MSNIQRLCGVLLFCLAALSCRRSAAPEAVVVPPPSGAAADAVLQAGEYPLWFQFSAAGALPLAAIEDAAFSTALVPWPLAVHTRFVLARGGDVLLAVNRDGFFRLSPREEPADTASDSYAPETELYRYPGGDFWKAYTIASFTFFDGMPLALLYRDDRFLETGTPLPSPRVWTFGGESRAVLSRDIPAFGRFPAAAGWDIDILRPAADGSWFYRALRKDAAKNETALFRTSDLAFEGGPVGLGEFQNASLPGSIDTVSVPLRSVLDALEPRDGVVSVLEQGARGTRYFARNGGDGQVDTLVFSGAGGDTVEIAAVSISGRGLYCRAARANASHGLLPLVLPGLPENFAYTAIAITGRTLIAAWEEQENFYIGAAGFMALKLPD